MKMGSMQSHGLPQVEFCIPIFHLTLSNNSYHSILRNYPKALNISPQVSLSSHTSYIPKYSEENRTVLDVFVLRSFFTDNPLYYNSYTCKRKFINKKILAKFFYTAAKLNVIRNLLLTAIHSLRSSPSGNITACLRFPLPRVASACFKSSY